MCIKIKINTGICHKQLNINLFSSWLVLRSPLLMHVRLQGNASTFSQAKWNEETDTNLRHGSRFIMSLTPTWFPTKRDRSTFVQEQMGVRFADFLFSF